MPGRRVFQNFLALSGAQVVAMAAGAVTTFVVARALGPAAFGSLGFGIAVLSYFGLAVGMGTDLNGTREIARDNALAAKVVGTALAFRMAMAVALLAVLYAMTSAIDVAPVVKGVLLIQGVGMFAIAISVEFVFQARQRMGVLALRQIAASVIGLAAVVFLVAAPDDVFIAAAIPVAVNLLMAAVLLTALAKSGGRLFLLDFSYARQFLKRSAPVALMAVLTTVYINLDIVILGFLRPQVEVGLYVAAARLGVFGIVFCNILHNAFLPALAAARDSTEERTSLAGHFATALQFLGWPIAVFGALFAGPIIEALFGADYSPAAVSMAILMINVAFFHLTVAGSTPLLAWNCDRSVLTTLIFGAGLNVVLNFILIPAYGIEGAAVATLIAQIAVWLSFSVTLKRRFGIGHWRGVLKSGVVAVASALPSLVLSAFLSAGSLLGLAVHSLIYSGVYLLLALVFGIVRLNDLTGLFRPGR